MKSSTFWSVVGAILAIIVAFWLVNAVLHLVWFAAKLGVVVVIAAVVYFGIKALFKGNDRDRR